MSASEDLERPLGVRRSVRRVATNSKRRGAEHLDSEFLGQRGKVRHAAFGNDAHGFLNTAGVSNPRDPQL